jgi:hypothetical protein
MPVNSPSDQRPSGPTAMNSRSGTAGWLLPPRTYLLAAAGIAIFTAGWVVVQMQGHSLHQENGVMENFQAGCLAVGMVFFVLGLRDSNATAPRILLFGLALLYGSFLVLEVDTRKLDLPTLNRLLNGRIRDAWLGMLWLFGAILFLRHRQAVWRTFVAWVRSPAGQLLVAAGVCWLGSGLVDKFKVAGGDLFVEELFEVNATLLMVLAAWKTKRGQSLGI